MNELELWNILRTKEDKTDIEKLLLHYRHILGNINEELMEKSKNHISDYDAIRYIRAIMLRINIPMTEL